MAANQPDASSVSALRQQRNTPSKKRYLIFHRWMAERLPRRLGTRHRLQRRILTALAFRAQAFGRSFRRKLSELEDDLMGDYCRRSIIDGLQLLRAGRLIDYRSDGRQLILTLCPLIFALIEKCKNHPAPNKEVETKKQTPRTRPSRRSSAGYVPYLSERYQEGSTQWTGKEQGSSYDDYKQTVLNPLSFDDWIESLCG